jgi:chromate transporter
VKATNNLQNVVDVFLAFLKLGLTAFGGPIAHIGYYRTEFISKRQWLSEQQFSQLLAVTQFLPGPASSQMGFSIGLFRAGWMGAIAAFIAFTLPSAILLFAFSSIAHQLDNPIGMAIIDGLKLVAVAVVAHAVISMVQKLTPDWQRILIALFSFALLLLFKLAIMQIAVIILGGLAGWFLCRQQKLSADFKFPVNYGKQTAWILFSLFMLLLILSLFAASDLSVTNMLAGFYQAGALVFGGGHVVLPLLEQQTVATGWLTTGQFLTGYGAAQAVPGPMFTLATYLGAELPTQLPSGWNALLATLAIFVPGFLLLLAMLPLWQQLAHLPNAGAVVAGINAAVVGLLAAALYDPIFTEGVNHWLDLLIALGGFLIIFVLKRSALWTVLFCVVASVVTALI